MVTEADRYTEKEAHRHFAVKFHGQTWKLLDKPERSREEEERMIHAAHASCHHWLTAGTGVNHQRGQWLLAQVYSVAGVADRALAHARRCMELTEEHRDAMEDFDLAFAYECVARAHAVAGNREDARDNLKWACEAGRKISDKEDLEIFEKTLEGGDWHGVK